MKTKKQNEDPGQMWEGVPRGVMHSEETLPCVRGHGGL